METKMHSPKFLRQRKFLMVLPLMAIPFLIAIFAALGGGKGDQSGSSAAQPQIGLNLKLPDAHFKKGKEKNKLGLYEEAGKDSDKIRLDMKNDPYFKLENHQDEPENKAGALQNIFQKSAAKFNQASIAGNQLNPFVTNNTTDANEKKVMDKLAELKTELKKKSENIPADYSAHNLNAVNPEIERLQRLMSAMKQNNNNASDPELNQINGMLDKVMNIQHPEKLQDSMKKLSEKNKPQSFPVQMSQDFDTSEQTGFYGLSEGTMREEKKSNAIEAFVEEDQTLVSGAVVKLRLLQDIYVNGMRIAKDELVYGISSLSNERLKIVINSVRSNDNIFPVSLEVYDMDGLAGIYVPGSITRDVSKESADEAVSGIGLTTFDQSLGAQAASAGIQAAKTLMNKKIKQVRVSVKAGYQVLLKDNNQKSLF
jgi:conjugative transposon TraM protein